MPVRRRVGRVSVAAVNQAVFRYGDGTWTYFHGDPVYPSLDAAEREWRRVRASVWAATPVGRIPAAAAAFDGLNDVGPAGPPHPDHLR